MFQLPVNTAKLEEEAARAPSENLVSKAEPSTKSEAACDFKMATF